MRYSKKFSPDYIRSAFFGVEDSLISTTGALAGIAIGSGNKSVILLTGLVIIAVESTSMGASEFISEETEEEIEKLKLPANPKISGLLIFISYVIAGLVPLAPYLFLTPAQAMPVSITLALVGLAVLGVVKGKLTKLNTFKSALEVLVIGGIATSIGIVVGIVFKV